MKAVVAPRIKYSMKDKIIVSKEVASAEAEEEEEALENEASGVMSFFGSRALCGSWFQETKFENKHEGLHVRMARGARAFARRNVCHNLAMCGARVWDTAPCVLKK